MFGGKSSGWVLAMACTFLTAGVGEAVAQEVFADPGSPAGKEYAVPLESARGAGAPPQEGRGDVGGRSSPAFGVGITPRARNQADGALGGGAAGSSSGSGERGDSVPRGGSGARAVATLATQSDGLSAGAVTGVIGLGVLLAGGLLAAFLRALRDSQ